MKIFKGYPEEDASHILSKMVPAKKVDPCVDYLGRRTKGQACPDIAFRDLLVLNKK